MEKYEIQKLRDLPIEEVAAWLGMQVSGHRTLCPFHDDHHASLTFSQRRNQCRCWVCMDHPLGTIDLVMRHAGLDFPAACRWLAQAGGVWCPTSRTSRTSLTSLSRPTSPTTPPPPAPPFDAGRYARFFEHPWLSGAARKFLFGERRIDPRVAAWCRLTSWTDREGTDWLQVPYFDTRGRLTGIQSRRLSQGTPRFRFPRGAQCGIYNLPVTGRLAPGERLYITEGCSDCWAMLSAGHKAIAIPSATLLSDADRQWLRGLGERMQTEWHMYPDQDTPGERLFLQLREVLPSLTRHRLPPGCKDFSDYYLARRQQD